VLAAYDKKKQKSVRGGDDEDARDSEAEKSDAEVDSMFDR
jgi:hypothetical protein